MKLILLASLTWTILSGCATLHSQPTPPQAPPSAEDLAVTEQFVQAANFEDQNQWSEAIALYREIAQRNATRNADLSARAMYLSSFCFEAMGDEGRNLSALKDAQGFAAKSRADDLFAQISSRLAETYEQAGDSAEAKKQGDEADLHLGRLINEGDKAKIAQTLYLMGRLGINQVSEDNLLATMAHLKKLQQYSLRAAEVDQDPYSKKSADRLVLTYKKIWATILSLPPNSTLDPIAAKNDLYQRQLIFAQGFLDNINDLRKFYPNDTSGSNQLYRLTDFVDHIENDVIDFMKKGTR